MWVCIAAIMRKNKFNLQGNKQRRYKHMRCKNDHYIYCIQSVFHNENHN